MAASLQVDRKAFTAIHFTVSLANKELTVHVNFLSNPCQ